MIIVTGGAGFIGSNIVLGLNNMGFDDILIVDNLKNSSKHLNINRARFVDFVDKVDFVEDIDKFGGSVDLIFHDGACTNTMEYDGKYMMQNNYEYSKRILEFCIKNRVRLIYASSASVYGSGKNGFREDRACEYPLNIYAFSKLAFDNYVRGIIKGSGIQIVGLRYFNVYGPQENHKGKMASVIFHFHNQILKEGKMKLFEGSEGFKRDFIYVKDIVAINRFFFENPDISGIFNAGTGLARSFLDIANIMKGLYDGAEIEYIPFPDTLKGKYQAFTQADLTNIKKVGYNKPFTSLEDGVKEYVKLLKENGGYVYGE